MSGYLRQLPYRRLVCLLLAAGQLLLLPDAPEIHRSESALSRIRVFPDNNQNPNK